MKNSIKILLVVTALMISSDLFAQTYGIKAGLNFSSMLLKYDGETFSDEDEFKMSPGFHIGGSLEIPISENISFETGLLLSTKGYKYVEEDDDYEGKEIVRLFYADIPLTAKVSISSGDTKFYGLFGPYVGMGLSGKYIYKYEDDGDSETETEDVEWGSDEDDDDLKRLDFGLVVGAGVEIKSIQLGVFYNLGLANISSDTEDDNKAANRVLGLSLGYRFGGK